ncbi:CLUMA_CG019699, isoform A [Clunio marinus]|uniref:CLUMA_CG019699, isoform A n=1 Tax=Clunio marinus TaxID=568069 RepID=A0A1J1J5A8_9DIPT|nr:CLUMA_CG019699, isoform A [Clunio marinus]
MSSTHATLQNKSKCFKNQHHVLYTLKPAYRVIVHTSMFSCWLSRQPLTFYVFDATSKEKTKRNEKGSKLEATDIIYNLNLILNQKKEDTDATGEYLMR